MYFWKKVYAVYNVIWGKAEASRSWGIFEFCVKSNLTVCKVTFNCKVELQKKLGSRV